MSEKKEYSPVEVAREIAKRISGQLKKYEETLNKSKNSAHEIDLGQEPKDDNAECPTSLAQASLQGKSNSQAPTQSNAPKQESEDEESEEVKKKKKEGEKAEGDTEENSESEEKPEEKKEEKSFEFRKSESGMHTVQYKTMAKADLCKAKVDEGMSATDKKKVRADRNEGFKPHEKEKITADGYREFKVGQSQSDLKGKLKSKQKMPSKEDLDYPMAASEDGKINPKFGIDKPVTEQKEWTKPQTSMINATKPGKIKSNKDDQIRFKEEAAEKRKGFRKEGVLKSEDNQVKETKGIDLDKKRKADKDMENFKRPMEKNGEEGECKCEQAESKEKKIGVEKLKKFLGKEKQPSPGMVKEPQE